MKTDNTLVVRSIDLLTISEVTNIFNVNKLILRKWEKKGVLEAVRINERGDRRYKRELIQALWHKKYKVIRYCKSCQPISDEERKQEGVVYSFSPCPIHLKMQKEQKFDKNLSKAELGLVNHKNAGKSIGATRGS